MNKTHRVNAMLRMDPQLWGFLKLTMTLTGRSRSDIVEDALKSSPWLKEQVEKLKEQFPGYAKLASDILWDEEAEED